MLFERVILMTLGTWLFTKLRGEVVGTDDQGNRYYQDKRVIAGRRRKRWVIYQGEVEAVACAARLARLAAPHDEYAAADGGLPRKAWQKDHLRNLSGTDLAYRPPGSTLVNSPDKPKPPYEAWRPS